jgi:hypothetical protein
MGMEGEGNPIEQEQPKAVITIRLGANGIVKTDFPADPILAYGLLEQGKQAIVRHFENLSAPRIVPANGGALGGGPAPRRLLG